jgi:hypothetical protein
MLPSFHKVGYSPLSCLIGECVSEQMVFISRGQFPLCINPHLKRLAITYAISAMIACATDLPGPNTRSVTNPIFVICEISLRSTNMICNCFFFDGRQDHVKKKNTMLSS